ncbi:MAG: hypothetical protein HRU41_12475 [Saprospiraceae bacterium]|nr:hypothetical protein [Saprospiraceae bacterium]
MHESKLLKILKTLSDEEIRRFHKFIRSPYYSYKKHCVPFFEYVRKYHPEYTSGKLSKENVFHHLFPDRQFQSQKMRHVMTDLVNLLEEFLVAEQVQKRDFERKKLLRDAYGQRDLYEYFEKSTEEIAKELEALPYRNSFYQYESMKNLDQFFFHPSTKKHLVKENYLEQMDLHLDHFFEISKLKVAAEMAARSNILSKSYHTRYLNEILHESEKPEGSTLEVDLYGKARNLYVNDDRPQFLKATQIFLENTPKLHRNDKVLIFNHLLNFTIRKGNSGQQEYIEDSFKLYQIGIDDKILIKNNQMTDSSFTNICAIGIKLQKFDWVEQFIEAYSPLLRQDLQSNAKTLCLAFLFYGKKEFEKTEQLISRFQFTNPFYQVRGKILATRALFELFTKDESYYDLMISNLLAFNKYLSRNKTLGTHNKEVYIKFIQYLKTAINLKIKRQLSKSRKGKLKDKINNERQIINRGWIIAKIDEL